MNNFFVHSSSFIDDKTSIGEGAKIWHFCHILSGTTIGPRSIVGQNCMIGPDVSVGAGCKIQNNVSLYKGVTLEDDVFCGPSCVFTNVINPRAFIERKDEFRPTVVKKGASIGANATVLCGVTIGAFALIGAGAVVLRDVRPYEIVVGVPGRHAGWVCACGQTLSQSSAHTDQFHCSRCDKKYSLLTHDEGPHARQLAEL
jgi:UDP-2-acetamido-3-amino-2,3-dideoxy-glucuronate N-acetyltransferase